MKIVKFAALGLAAGLFAAPPASAQLSIDISVGMPPPPLPVYVQPPLPGPDFIWTPGYWAWDDIEDAYYWVPGTWVRAPRPGLLWTPPWWGWSGGAYIFHGGYWGPHVGFYGGVPYGFGYTGFGYQGGYWNGGHVFYNRVVNNVTNVHITNVYQQNVVINRITRVSYNGGPGGVQARPGRQDWIAAHEAHVAATPNQFAHFAAARSDPRLFARANHGQPPVVATARPLAFDRAPAPHGWQTHGGAPGGGDRSFAAARQQGFAAAAPMPVVHGGARVDGSADAVPMPVVHRGSAAPWQRDGRMAAPASPPTWHGAPPPDRGGGWDRRPPTPRPDAMAMGGHGWGGPPHGPAPRVAFHAPPHAPHAPHGGGGGGGHHGHHG